MQGLWLWIIVGKAAKSWFWFTSGLSFQTFISHGSDIAEPFLDAGDPVWGVLMSPAGYLGDGGHRALQGSTRLGHHGVVTKVEIQGLHNVGWVVAGS